MRFIFSLSAIIVIACSSLQAGPKDPLRLIPDSMDEVIKIESPRALAEAILKHDLSKEAQKLQLVREFLDGADYRKIFQLIAYFEKELGAKWPESLARIAGGGIAAGLKLGGQNPPAMLVIQGTDEKTTTKFFDTALTLLEDELTRQGAKEMLARKKYQGVECIQIDKGFVAARAGDAIILATKGELLKAAIDLHVGSDKKAKSVAQTTATKDVAGILPPNPAAWLWVNMKPIKELPQAKDLFTTPRNEVVQTVLFAGYLDVARRSDFIAAGLYHDKGDFRFTVRMPAGRDGMATDVELHLPRDPKVGGSLPLLEPKGVLFSYSFYMDFDTFYSKREAIFPPQVAKDIAEGEKQISRILINTSLPKFLSQSGVHHRIVVVPPTKVEGYKTEPDQKLPGVAFITSMRDPAFAKSVNALVKAGVLALGTQASLRSWEEEIAGVPTFGYSFPENGKFPEDPQGLRFNYQPTFGAYKDQYIAASSKGLFREVAGLLEKEDRSKVCSQNMQARAYATALGQYANIAPEQTLAGTILSQALRVGEARQQTDALFAFLQKLGMVQIETDYTASQFRFDLVWKTKK
jgi:hypothetical protein